MVARLRDAAFFFARGPQAAARGAGRATCPGVTFHQGLGSYADKAARMARLVDAMGATRRLRPTDARRRPPGAARLAKADLTTLMVRRVPRAAGRDGRLYLRRKGDARRRRSRGSLALPPAVARGRRAAGGRARVDERRCSPRCRSPTSSTPSPATSASATCPTGSSDPYGLRRAGQGAVRVLLDFWTATPAAVPTFTTSSPTPWPGTAALAEASGRRCSATTSRLSFSSACATSSPPVASRPDEVDAVLGAREPDALADPQRCLARLAALHDVRRGTPHDFEPSRPPSSGPKHPRQAASRDPGNSRRSASPPSASCRGAWSARRGHGRRLRGAPARRSRRCGRRWTSSSTT